MLVYFILFALMSAVFLVRAARTSKEAEVSDNEDERKPVKDNEDEESNINPEDMEFEKEDKDNNMDLDMEDKDKEKDKENFLKNKPVNKTANQVEIQENQGGICCCLMACFGKKKK